jgi:lipopolysaccharide transport system ATP-binding protein
MSSSDLAFSVRGVFKAYTIRHQEEHHITLAEQLLHWVRHPLQRSLRENFWALADVSFDVRRGEVLGIIGRNGAGKSTLLKILSRITPPTQGEVWVYGRVGSLLEVGTGFHPELTGRENIYLNGAILGMRKRVIDRRFDEIVDFAGVEKFLDTPVKRFSSGMYVRLAFAVAAHLDTDILLVDEVLAVGDADFQRKCLGKMGDVASMGRTVLFVSHNMHSISTICDEALLLRSGSLALRGPVHEVIGEYLVPEDFDRPSELESEHARGTGEARVIAASPSQAAFRPEEPKRFNFMIENCSGDAGSYWLSIVVRDQRSAEIVTCDSRAVDFLLDREESKSEVEFAVHEPWLKPGRYTLDVSLCAIAGIVDESSSGIVDERTGVCTFDVLPFLPYDTAVPDGVFDDGIVLGRYGFEWGNDEAPPENL